MQKSYPTSSKGGSAQRRCSAPRTRKFYWDFELDTSRLPTSREFGKTELAGSEGYRTVR